MLWLLALLPVLTLIRSNDGRFNIGRGGPSSQLFPRVGPRFGPRFCPWLEPVEYLPDDTESGVGDGLYGGVTDDVSFVALAYATLASRPSMRFTGSRRAISAAPLLVNVTNPNPLDFPVWRSWITTASWISPYCWNAYRRVSLL